MGTNRDPRRKWGGGGWGRVRGGGGGAVEELSPDATLLQPE